jgi:hypothetical protein
VTRKIADRLIAGLSVAALLAPAVPVLASTLSDLEGVRASAAENTIQSRGYHAYHSSPGGGGSHTYWWNNGTKSCVRTLTSNGVIASTKTVSGSDCGYYGNDSDGKKSGSGNDAAVAAAVAAAAIIGVAALSHKSHHRDDKEYSEPQSYADFERGHRDGLYNHSYENHSRSDAYSDGYRSGVDEREQQSSYRRNTYAGNDGGGGYRGGSNDPVDISDLVGSRAAGVDSDLQSRGFRSVDNFQSGNGKGTVWWNGRTRQCLQMITADGRADSITDIQTHPRCR